MNPSRHVLAGILFSVFLFFLFPELGFFPIILVFASSILVDVDHYFFYIYKKRNFNLRKAYSAFMEQKIKWRKFGKNAEYDLYPSFLIFHGLEVLLLLFLLSFLFKPLYFIFIGFSFHLFFDLVEQAIYVGEFKKISIVNDFLNYKNK